MAVQRFKLREGVGGLPGEYVCAGCEAPMTMAEPSGAAPAEALEMNHGPECPEVVRLSAGRA